MLTKIVNPISFFNLCSYLYQVESSVTMMKERTLDWHSITTLMRKLPSQYERESSTNRSFTSRVNKLWNHMSRGTQSRWHQTNASEQQYFRWKQPDQITGHVSFRSTYTADISLAKLTSKVYLRHCRRLSYPCFLRQCRVFHKWNYCPRPALSIQKMRKFKDNNKINNDPGRTSNNRNRPFFIILIMSSVISMFSIITKELGKALNILLRRPHHYSLLVPSPRSKPNLVHSPENGNECKHMSFLYKSLRYRESQARNWANRRSTLIAEWANRWHIVIITTITSAITNQTEQYWLHDPNEVIIKHIIMYETISIHWWWSSIVRLINMSRNIG